MERWIGVGEEKDLDESGQTRIDGHLIALFRLDDGIYAIDDICSHEYSRLSEGEIWDGEVYCPKHGSRFNIRTGAVTGLPATQPVKSYSVKVEAGRIFVKWNAQE